MPIPTQPTLVDPLVQPAKAVWEDPALVLERDLQARAQGDPPVGGPPEVGPNHGFLGPLSTSGGGSC